MKSLTPTIQTTATELSWGLSLISFNRPEAFWCFQGPNHPYSDLSYGVNKPGHIRIPASEMLAYLSTRKMLPISWSSLFACVMKALHQLDGYMEAELIAARLAAAKSLFLTSPDGMAYDGDDYEDYAHPRCRTWKHYPTETRDRNTALEP